MKTVPFGNAHSPLGANLICSSAVYGGPSLGTAIQRLLMAPSDHNGELTVNGITPVAGVRSRTSLKAPVADSEAGNASAPAVEGIMLFRKGPIGSLESRP
jgi:hypothetical protein